MNRELPPNNNIEQQPKEKYIYSGVFLNEESRERLVTAVNQLLQDGIPDSWQIVAHHMTTHFFTQEDPVVEQFNKLHDGENFDLFATSLGVSDKAIAVDVETEAPSANEHKHITVAIAENASPVDANDIQNWVPIATPIPLRGVLGQFNVPVSDEEQSKA
ncbi:MAG: hypothetical protein LBQ02_04130 [Candidatus Nomurabacteria bacterium]|jgi:hypothetical protein|nr:hypothetical protein [Candidatus Nomurabacteria bacterium]